MRAPASPQAPKPIKRGEIEMTDLATTFGPEDETTVEPTPSPTSAETAPTTLITEQQVLFSTAAAVALPATKKRSLVGLMHEVVAKVRAFVSADVPPARRHYPTRRYDFLEHSRMAREMDRL
jgi:hypothetical protein